MAKAESKNVVLDEISEKLGEISSSMASIEENLNDISMSYQMLVFFKLAELRPDMKDKLMPLVDDMIESMDFNMPEE
jgi:argonaute-like protein implicated in RNA metabolism and viral defense